MKNKYVFLLDEKCPKCGTEVFMETYFYSGEPSRKFCDALTCGYEEFQKVDVVELDTKVGLNKIAEDLFYKGKNKAEDLGRLVKVVQNPDFVTNDDVEYFRSSFVKVKNEIDEIFSDILKISMSLADRNNQIRASKK